MSCSLAHVGHYVQCVNLEKLMGQCELGTQFNQCRRQWTELELGPN